MRFHNMNSFSSVLSSPEAAFLASTNQLKRLLLVYRTKGAAAIHCFLWHTVLLYVANAVIRKKRLVVDPDWELWFLLCLAGYKALFRCFKASGRIYRALLFMAVRNGLMAAADAQEAMKKLDAVKTPTDHTVIDNLSTMIVDLDLAITDPAAAQAGILAEKFNDLALFEEFIISTAAGDGRA